MLIQLELVIAALAPVLVAVAVTSHRALSRELGRAVRWWFAPLALLWFAPSWLAGSTPAPFDVLSLVWPWRALSHGPAVGNALLNDPIFQFIPWRAAQLRALLQGAWPFLDRSAGSGAALWANPQAAVAYPLTWLGAWLSPAAWPLFAAESKLLIASTGTYLFLRREGRSHLAGVFGAIAYAWSVFSLAFLLFPQTNVTVLLPWLLVAVQRCDTRFRWRTVVGCVFVVFCAVAGGHPESLFHCALIVGPFAIRKLTLTAREDRAAVGLRLAVVGLAGALLAAPLLLPFASLAGSSERRAQLAHEPMLVAAPPATLDNATAFVLPTYLADRRVAFWGDNFNEVATQYAGLATLALAIFAAVCEPRRQKVWIAVAVLAAVLAFRFGGVSGFIVRVPVVGLFLHGRVRFVLAFVTALLAARGFDLAVERRRDRLLWIVMALVALVGAGMLVRGWTHACNAGILGHAVVGLGVAVVSLGVVWVAVRKLRLLPLVVVAVAGDLAAVMLDFYPPVARAWAYPRTPAIARLQQSAGEYRVACVGPAMMPNSAAVYGLEDIGAHDPMTWEPYARLLSEAGYDRRGYFAIFQRVPPQALLDFLGVRYVLAPPDQDGSSLPVAYRGADGVIFSNPSALPRFFVPAAVDVSDAPVEAFRRMPDARVVHLSRGEVARVAAADLRVVEYRPNGSVIHARAYGETFVASSEVAMPGWELRLDGASWQMLRVNGVFVGWRVPPGDHVFTLTYTPPHFRLGVLIALLAAPLTLFLLWRDRRAPSGYHDSGAVAPPLPGCGRRNSKS